MFINWSLLCFHLAKFIFGLRDFIWLMAKLNLFLGRSRGVGHLSSLCSNDIVSLPQKRLGGLGPSGPSTSTTQPHTRLIVLAFFFFSESWKRRSRGGGGQIELWVVATCSSARITGHSEPRSSGGQRAM